MLTTIYVIPATLSKTAGNYFSPLPDSSAGGFSNVCYTLPMTHNVIVYCNWTEQGITYYKPWSVVKADLAAHFGL